MPVWAVRPIWVSSREGGEVVFCRYKHVPGRECVQPSTVYSTWIQERGNEVTVLARLPFLAGPPPPTPPPFSAGHWTLLQIFSNVAAGQGSLLHARVSVDVEPQ